METKTKWTIMFNVLLFTSIIGMAISYASTILYPYLPKLSFLEGVGVYCIWTPIHHGLNAIINKRDFDN